MLARLGRELGGLRGVRLKGEGGGKPRAAVLVPGNPPFSRAGAGGTQPTPSLSVWIPKPPNNLDRQLFLLGPRLSLPGSAAEESQGTAGLSPPKPPSHVTPHLLQLWETFLEKVTAFSTGHHVGLLPSSLVHGLSPRELGGIAPSFSTP